MHAPHRDSGSPFSAALTLQREAHAGEGTLPQLPNYCMSQLNWVTHETGLFLTAANAVPHPLPNPGGPETTLPQGLRMDRTACSLLVTRCLAAGEEGPSSTPHTLPSPLASKHTRQRFWSKMMDI